MLPTSRETWLTVHLSCVALSIGLFALRAGLALAGRSWRSVAALRVLPHLNDTLLFVAGVMLCVITRQWPWEQPWLAAKLLTLVAYVVLGARALRPDLGTRVRAVRVALALAAAGAIVVQALTRQPLPLALL